MAIILWFESIYLALLNFNLMNVQFDLIRFTNAFTD